MDAYELQAKIELATWQKKMLRHPSLLNKLAKRMQTKINGWIPEKIHLAITAAIKQMIRGVLFAAKHTTSIPLIAQSLQLRETTLREKIKFYRKTAAAEGGITGAGGLLLGLADFPILLGFKIKLLFEIASIYGFDVKDYKERLYILHIFELAFSSHAHRKEVYLRMVDWDKKSKNLPSDLEQFDWRSLQQEYRDYIDLAKMAQLVPVIGAPVGIIANYHLIERLGITAMNAYRMRLYKTNVNDNL
jgi:hypothetical protein